MRSVSVQFRPWVTWPGKATPSYDRRRGQFKSRWMQTRTLLEKELWHLGAKNVVIEMDVEERYIRRDGLPYENAKPNTPGVILSFDSPHGPLRYPCDTYADWQDNIRAIA